MKKWLVRHLTTERKLGTVLAEWAEEATDVASAEGYRRFYVELCGSGIPTEYDCVTLAASSSASSLALMFKPQKRRMKSAKPAKLQAVARPAHRSEAED